MAEGEGHSGDVELVRGALRGDRAAVRTFLERMRCVPRVLVLKNGKLGTPLDADELADLIQDTLLAVWAKLPGYDGRAALETWVYRFCQLELLRRLRARHRGHSILDETGDGPPAPSGAEKPEADELERLLEALDRLPAELGAVLHLKHYDELTFDQVGARLGISPNTAKTRYYRGLDKLRALFGQRMGAGSEGRP